MSSPQRPPKMRRAIDAHALKTMRFLPSLSSPPRAAPPPSSSLRFTATPIRSLFFGLAKPSPRFVALLLPPPPPTTRCQLRAFSVSRTLTPPASSSITSPAVKHLRTRRGLDSDFGRLAAKCISSVNSVHSLEWNEPVSCSEVVGEVESGEVGVVEEDAKPAIPVRAYFFSTSVDLRSLVDQNKANFIPPASRMTNYVVLKFGNLSNAYGLGASLSGSDCCFMVVFQYGSIVLFNVREHDVDGYLKIVEKHASGLLPEMRKDEYEVREKPTLSTWMEGGLDFIMLQYINIDGIRTIGSVLGQSIALDYYVRQVDGMVAEFTDINRGMEKTGTFEMDRKKLFQLVGKANSNLADVILKLGLFERSDIAWKNAKYAQIWEYLRDEFELTQRFASLDFKLKFVEHNIRFLQEILQNRKSDFLEWLIIILIGAEILISVYDILTRSAISKL
ncbi:protein RETARDED ROOT GROWTH-LIKE-like [Syzygium oleosum]|uniref:protein RETARDED ROOT GROWTH-LIKE-like n=1 Tax=Syzygium oleosum TaxID=219896 RepID=UPI0024BA2C55|nr:protein RETARDED ROOT GROWTH-LIKE-like [Syzygium oleosum]